MGKDFSDCPNCNETYCNDCTDELDCDMCHKCVCDECTDNCSVCYDPFCRKCLTKDNPI